LVSNQDFIRYDSISGLIGAHLELSRRTILAHKPQAPSPQQHKTVIDRSAHESSAARSNSLGHLANFREAPAGPRIYKKLGGILCRKRDGKYQQPRWVPK
jgi:hypothetical protein